MTISVLNTADLAANQWAVCGQTALAALLHLPLADVRRAVPEGRVWMNHKDMREALVKLGAKQRTTGYELERGDTRTPPCRWPSRGLALIQFRGPWEEPTAPHVACLKHTHWVAAAPMLDGQGKIVPGSELDPMVFDVNALSAGWNGGWMPRSWWAKSILAPLIASHRRATGAWYVRAGIEVLT